MGFTTDLSENMEHFKNTLHVDQCFDVVYRVVEIGGRKGCLFFVDGMTKDEVLLSFRTDPTQESRLRFPRKIRHRDFCRWYAVPLPLFLRKPSQECIRRKGGGCKVPPKEGRFHRVF